MIDTRQMLSQDLKQLLVSRSEDLIRQNHDFLQGLDEIGGLLSQYDLAPSPILNAIDQKGQDFATYFFIAYWETRDFEKSIKVYNAVKSLVRYILLMDRFYEVGNKKYERMAKGILSSLKKAHGGHLKYSVDFALKQFWPFWDFEQLVKKELLKGHVFGSKELRHFNLFKSSDALIIYSQVLDNELPLFNPNVALVIHYNQALQDIQDDFEDIEEDMHDKMPNIFTLAATQHMRISDMMMDPRQTRKLIAGSGVGASIVEMIDNYNELINSIDLPRNYAFLKQLSKDYSGKLLSTFGVQ